jgi:hypothetical protein
MKIHLSLDREEVATLIGMLTWFAANGKVHPDDYEAIKMLTIKLSMTYNEAVEKEKGR